MVPGLSILGRDPLAAPPSWALAPVLTGVLASGPGAVSGAFAGRAPAVLTGTLAAGPGVAVSVLSGSLLDLLQGQMGAGPGAVSGDFDGRLVNLVAGVLGSGPGAVSGAWAGSLILSVTVGGGPGAVVGSFSAVPEVLARLFAGPGAVAGSFSGAPLVSVVVPFLFRDPQGDPVEGVTVRAVPLRPFGSVGRVVHVEPLEALTDEDGLAVLDLVLTGGAPRYRVTAFREAETLLEAELTVTPDLAAGAAGVAPWRLH